MYFGSAGLVVLENRESEEGEDQDLDLGLSD